jgi:hypothetical protein
MSYWIIYAIFICVEEVADTFIGWFPFYYTAKIIALILLQWPKLNVSARMCPDLLNLCSSWLPQSTQCTFGRTCSSMRQTLMPPSRMRRPSSRRMQPD